MADKSSRPATAGVISEEEALYGFSTEPNIVAIEPGPQNGAVAYIREGHVVRAEQVPFQPWLLTSAPPVKAPRSEVTRLLGNGLKYLVTFDNWRDARDARFGLRDAGTACLGYEGARAILMRKGQTLFKHMAFADVYRMQFDIETNGLDPTTEDGAVFMVAVSDTRGMLQLIEGTEVEIIERFSALVRDCDPDVLEGHNVFGFDLPFLMERARRNGIPLSLGRDGSDPVKGRERSYAIGGAVRPFTPVHIYGRHVLDTFLIVQRFDWAKGSLTSYGLKACARQFGFAAEDRIELPGREISSIYRSDPERVREYARHDAIETRLLADLITPVEFYQTQMMPDSYENTAVTGSGEKINAMLIRAYMHAGHSIPIKEQGRPFAGAYTEVRKTGVMERVVKADVESLYPSLMLAHGIAPERDTLGVFLPALNGLTERRVQAKKQAASEPDPARAQYLDGLQNSFKVLINSFYGYLAGPFPWNDSSAAGRVTALGRDTVLAIAGRLTQDGSQVIEVDTDGVYFVPPVGVEGEADERAYVQQVGEILPTGVRLAFDGRYRRMLSIKTKNYVLETYEGKLLLKGASLRSRSDEMFGRRFLESAVAFLLEGHPDSAANLYREIAAALTAGNVNVRDLTRRERVTSKTFSSSQRRKLADAAQGISIGEHVYVYSRSDGTLGVVSETGETVDFKPDTRLYLDKLYRFACRLEAGVGPGFSSLFPAPAELQREAAGQGVLDLF